MKSSLGNSGYEQKKKVIHISTAPTTATIPYTILTLMMILLTSCMSAIYAPKPALSAPSTALVITEIESGEVYEIPTETQTPALCAVVTAEQALHLRTAPSETSQVKEWLLHGEIVRVISRAGEWLQVEAGPTTGYASADFLQETECK